jgi:hypothetical protein
MVFPVRIAMRRVQGDATSQPVRLEAGSTSCPKPAPTTGRGLHVAVPVSIDPALVPVLFWLNDRLERPLVVTVQLVTADGRIDMMQTGGILRHWRDDPDGLAESWELAACDELAGAYYIGDLAVDLTAVAGATPCMVDSDRMVVRVTDTTTLVFTSEDEKDPA